MFCHRHFISIPLNQTFLTCREKWTKITSLYCFVYNNNNNKNQLKQQFAEKTCWKSMFALFDHLLGICVVRRMVTSGKRANLFITSNIICGMKLTSCGYTLIAPKYKQRIQRSLMKFSTFFFQQFSSAFLFGSKAHFSRRAKVKQTRTITEFTVICRWKLFMAFYRCMIRSVCVAYIA